MLAPYLDEIELLLFESAPGSLPSKHVIKNLSLLSKEFSISYNVHMPIDIYLGDHDPKIRQYAIDATKRVIDLTEPISPSTYTLHLAYNNKSFENEQIKKWQEMTYSSMDQLVTMGISNKTISIENLMYPFEWAEELIRSFNLSVCIDLGHLLLQGCEPGTIFDKFEKITPIIHLYGVGDLHEHLPLDRLSKKDMASVMGVLRRFTGVLSLEVFSYSHLRASLKYLEACWQTE